MAARKKKRVVPDRVPKPTTPFKRRDGVETHTHADAEEMEVRKAYVAKRLAQGATVETLITECGKRFSLTPVMVRRAVDHAYTEWKTTYDKDAVKLKSAQMQRICLDLEIAQKDFLDAKSPKDRKDALVSLIRLEQLYARIAGTLDPIKMRLDADAALKDNLTAYIGQLTQEQQEQLIQEQLDLEAKAKLVN